MDERVKQRLVGAAVLTVMAVIFIPMALDTSDYESLPWKREIPARPLPPLPEHLELPPVAGEPPAVAAPGAPSRAPVIPAEDEPAVQTKRGAGGPEAWVVQVGSFGQEDNALALREKLRKMGLPAFVTPVQGDGGTVFRVRIGPDLKRSRAEQIREQMERELELKAVVKRHAE